MRLLGSLEVLRGGARVDLPASKKARALLGYLVATQRAHSREHLCGLLWDVADDPRAALRWTLTKIRPLFDQPSVVRLRTERDLVRFDAGEVAVDVLAMRADVAGGTSTASVEALRRAAGRFRGEFLEGLEVSPSYRFHSWSVAERDSLRSTRLGILRALVQRLRDRPDEAVRYAREVVGVDPLSEAAYVDLVSLLGMLGRTREALREYDTCKRILDRELGARPSAALEAARASLQRSPPPAPAPTTTELTVTPRRATREPEVAFVGRSEERATLARIVAGDGAGRPVVLLLGDAGMGKTRLLDELQASVEAKAGLVIRGRAFEAERVRPYGPWVDALRSTPVTQLSTARQSRAGGDRAGLFEGVSSALAELGARSRIVLVFDDLQWFDEGSTALLHFVARTVSRPTMAIVCAARGGDLADNRPALRLRRSLQREGLSTEIVLAPLEASSIREPGPAGRAGRRLDPRVLHQRRQSPLRARDCPLPRGRGRRALGVSRPAPARSSRLPGASGGGCSFLGGGARAEFSPRCSREHRAALAPADRCRDRGSGATRHPPSGHLRRWNGRIRFRPRPGSRGRLSAHLRTTPPARSSQDGARTRRARRSLRRSRGRCGAPRIPRR